MISFELKKVEKSKLDSPARLLEQYANSIICFDPRNPDVRRHLCALSDVIYSGDSQIVSLIDHTRKRVEEPLSLGDLGVDLRRLYHLTVISGKRTDKSRYMRLFSTALPATLKVGFARVGRLRIRSVLSLH